MTEKLSILN